MLSSLEKKKLYVLLDGLCEKKLSDAQFEQLDQWLRLDPEARRLYVQYMQMWVDLPYLWETLQSKNNPSSTSLTNILDDDCLTENDLSDSAIWQALLDAERNAPGIIPLKTPESQKETATNSKVKSGKNSSRFWLFTALLSSAALLFVLLLPFIPKFPVEMVTVSDMMDVVWSEQSRALTPQQRLRTGHSIQFESGYLKLSYDEGVKVVIEGPANVSLLDKDLIFLQSGQVSALVGDTALGFTIETPTSKIIDRGTEFGVQVADGGTTATHMFSGMASISTKSQTKETPLSILTEGQAQKMDVSGAISDVEFEDRRFVREVDSSKGFVWRGEPIHLGDVFVGGDGWATGNPNLFPISYSAIMNRPEMLFVSSITDSYQAVYNPSDPCYFSVPHPYIDGLFIPDAGDRLVNVSSQGHVYRECPDTRGVSWKPILDKDEDVDFLHYNVRLGSTEYEKVIVLHSNLGVTFDLQAMRDSHPGTTISHFQCLLGVQKHYKASTKDASYVAHVDLHILLDGEAQHRQKRMTAADKPLNISIPILAQNRFLTLMATDGNDQSIDLDYGVFAEPYLILENRHD